jgi:hypothetical protein
MYNLPVRWTDIYGYQDTGLIPMTDISGCRVYGYFHPNPDFYGHPLTGDIQEDIIVFTVVTGDLMLVFMAV